MKATFLFNNGIREIVVEDILDIIGWHLHGIWQWLAYNRLKYFFWLMDSSGNLFFNCLASHNIASFWAYARSQCRQQRSEQIPIILSLPCFCKGLTGNSLTDSAVAPAI